MRHLNTAVLLMTFLTIPGLIFAQAKDQEMIPSSAIAAIFMRPQDAFQQPSMELFPREIATEAGKENLGIDPMEITSATLLVDNFEDLERPPGFAVILRFQSPQQLSDNIIRELNEGELNGKRIYRAGGEMAPVIYVPDNQMMVIGMESFIKKMLAARGAQSELISLIDANRESESAHVRGFLVVEPVRGMISENLPPAGQVPPPFRDLLELPDLMRHVMFMADFSGDTKSEFTIGAIDEAAAQRMVEIIKDGYGTGRDMAMGMLAQQMQNESPGMQDAVQRYANRVAAYLEGSLIPPVEGAQITYRSEGQGQLTSVGTIGVLIGMLLPAVQQAREAARRVSAMNNLKQIALAFHNYESVYGEFPRNILSEDGKPLLSWRVALLPYMEQQVLYNQFHLDEPWDSDHNIQLLEMMPQIYQSPNLEPANRTVFLGFEGPGTIFEGKKTKFRDILDGTSNTIMCVEADEAEAIEWTKPADLPFDPKGPVRGVGHLRPGGFNAVMADGAARFISNAMDSETLSWLIQISDGNVVSGF